MDKELERLKELWEAFGDTPINESDEIDEPFHFFPKGTDREEVFHWFEEEFPGFSVGAVMEGRAPWEMEEDKIVTEERVKELVDFLNNNRPKVAPYVLQETKKYWKICTNEGHSVYCFVVKEDFSNKTLGFLKAGDLLKPASWSQPARHPRGNLFKRESWERAFGDYSMAYLR